MNPVYFDKEKIFRKIHKHPENMRRINVDAFGGFEYEADTPQIQSLILSRLRDDIPSQIANQTFREIFNTTLYIFQDKKIFLVNDYLSHMKSVQDIRSNYEFKNPLYYKRHNFSILRELIVEKFLSDYSYVVDGIEGALVNSPYNNEYPDNLKQYAKHLLHTSLYKYAKNEYKKFGHDLLKLKLRGEKC